MHSAGSHIWCRAASSYPINGHDPSACQEALITLIATHKGRPRETLFPASRDRLIGSRVRCIDCSSSAIGTSLSTSSRRATPSPTDMREGNTTTTSTFLTMRRVRRLTTAAPTIYALASGRPPCGVAIVRVSGYVSMTDSQCPRAVCVRTHVRFGQGGTAVPHDAPSDCASTYA